MSSVLKAKQVHRDPSSHHSRHKDPEIRTPETSAMTDHPQNQPQPPGLKQENPAVNQETQSRIKADMMEQEARMRAEGIIENAMKTSREIMEKAREQGFEEGYHRGLVEGGHEAFVAVQEKLDEIQQLAYLVEEERHREFRKEDRTLIGLAMEIARKIMKKTARLEEDVLEQMIEEVLSEHEGKCKVVISEYQRTLDFKVDKSLARRLKTFSKNASIVFVKEEDLILVETGSGVVDLSIPVQLAHLEQALEK